MKNRYLARAFDTFRQHATEQRRMKVIGIKVVDRMKNRYLARAFDTFRQHATEQRRIEQVGIKVVDRMKNKALASAFCSWNDHAADGRRLAALGTRVVLRLENRTLASAFEAWHFCRHVGTHTKAADRFTTTLSAMAESIESLMKAQQDVGLCHELVGSSSPLTVFARPVICALSSMLLGFVGSSPCAARSRR